MSLCINPHCQKPQNPDDILFCQTCGSELVLQGRYRVINQLGAGGFGVTFTVNEIRTNTPKVLKVLINNQQKAIDLFKQEADVLSQLHHPGIPKVERDAYFVYFPRNSENPIHCLVMEKIVGMDLEKYMKNRGLRPIDQTLALEWLEDIVSILEQVHNKNFFHRDIKPPNIMLRGSSGALVLIDFGTARQITQTIISQQGGVTGIVSAGYTPIEQINNKAEMRSDFFALGRTFIYLLTGKEPLDAEIYDADNDQINWRQYAPQISSELADLIDEMMARFPSHRPQNAQVILEKLKLINQGLQLPTETDPISGTVPKPPIKTNRRNAIKWIGFGVIGMVGVGVSYAFFPKNKSTLIVSGDGKGDYKTIGEAIIKAKQNTRILIRPGVYKESLIINKPLKIIGDGNRSEIIIESKNSSCIVMRTNESEVQGLTLRCLAGENNKKVFAVNIPQGELILSDCDITSDSLSCISIHGSTANPIIRNCVIHDGKESGIYVYKNGRGTVENCDIFSNTLAGVAIKDSANPIIRSCKIHDGKQGGVLIYKKGKGIVENCDIFSNTYSGVEIRESANPLIRQSKIYNGKRVGVLVQDNGQGTIEDCDIFSNAYSGVEIREGGNPLIRRCNINQNKENAVYVHDDGQGRIENCDLTGNLRTAFNIDSTSQVQRIGNQE